MLVSVLRILRVVSDLYPFVIGGLGIHAHEMSKCQANLGHEVTVFTCNNLNQNKPNKTNYEIIKCNSGVKIAGNTLSMSLFNKLLKEKKQHDIIHAHSHLFFSTNMCSLLRKLKSSPLVITNHGLISQRVPMWIQNAYMPTVGKWTFKSADKVICYTEEEKSQMVELGVEKDRIEVINNGIDTDLFIPNHDKQKTRQLLWVGRFIPGKGANYLIEAFKIVSDNHEDIKLLMVGDGPLRESIQKQILELNLEDKIDITTSIPNSKIPELYRNSDIFVLPSLEEGVPRTILEAMSCEVPIVCSKLPQLVDIVSKCGILVPKQDPEALAEAILKVLNDDDLARKYGENGRKRVVNEYSWEDTVKKTIQLYEKIIPSKDIYCNEMLKKNQIQSF